ncbi:MAG: twin-arginine translocation signal domain-containing protein [Rhodocyclaceae bacterium]|nr:twin-arginine translocation signal domain-containing protein [Rhodocyclaceae bacterium]
MDKKPEENTVNAARRGFLRKAGLASGAAAVAVVTPVMAQPEAPQAPQEEGASGYQETEHVRAYYQTARI